MIRLSLACAFLALAACQPRPEPAPFTGDLAAQLCDPESMQVAEVVVGKTVTAGMVNARTPGGGFAGAIPFAVDHASGHAMLAEPHWSAACPPRLSTAERGDLFVPDGVQVAH